MVQLAYCIYAWRLRRLYMVIFVCSNSCWIYGVAEILLESTDNNYYNMWISKKYGKDLESREQLLDSDQGSIVVYYLVALYAAQSPPDVSESCVWARFSVTAIHGRHSLRHSYSYCCWLLVSSIVYEYQLLRAVFSVLIISPPKIDCCQSIHWQAT